LKPAVVAIVCLALIRIGKKALRNKIAWGIAVLSFVLLYFCGTPFPYIILSSAALGFVSSKMRNSNLNMSVNTTSKENDISSVILSDNAEPPLHAKLSFKQTLKTLFICLVLWWTPVAVLGLVLGWNSVLVKEGLFFSKAAMVTFGGAYAVLPYVAQQAVDQFQWLTAGQMMDGLGLAETTPGPLIMVLQFVGFFGGWNHPQGLPVLLSATLGAFITIWVTFTPCFLWIFLGAPFIEKWRGNLKTAAALNAITASVVGVIFNLAVWFAYHVFFPNSHLDFIALVIFILALISFWKWERHLISVVLLSGVLGYICYFFKLIAFN
jgi:chromate transporter